MSSEPTTPVAHAPGSPEPPAHQPFVPPTESPPEFTLPAVFAGVVLGIIFGASSLYLVLKVGLTVSASVPIAVLSITLFRAISKAFNVRKTTILENNVVQTAGSAGESIAFGVGVTMPALLLLGFEMDPVRVMTVSVLGAILGILMMIPLRRAFIVKQHGKLLCLGVFPQRIKPRIIRTKSGVHRQQLDSAKSESFVSILKFFLPAILRWID